MVRNTTLAAPGDRRTTRRRRSAAWALFRVTALRIRSRPTTSATKACRAGLSAALKVPKASARTTTSPRLTFPLSTRIPSARETRPSPGLGDQQEMPLGEPVNQQARVRRQQQHRREPGGRGESEDYAGMSQPQHQQRLGDGLDPGADQAQRLPADVTAEVADRQGREHPRRPAGRAPVTTAGVGGPGSGGNGRRGWGAHGINDSADAVRRHRCQWPFAPQLAELAGSRLPAATRAGLRCCRASLPGKGLFPFRRRRCRPGA